MHAQRIARFEAPVVSTAFGPHNEFFSLSSNGEIYIHGSGEGGLPGTDIELWGNSGGQPTNFLVDARGTLFICDAAHQAVFRTARIGDGNGAAIQESETYVKDYEGRPLLGPNSVTSSKQTGALFFTDSGPLGESSFTNPCGSVFMVHPRTQLCLPLAHRALAHPSGVALSTDEKYLYVAETLKNRIVRFAQKPQGVWHMSVWLQLAGRLGPTALCALPNGCLAVAHYDFGSPNGDNQQTGQVEEGRILIVSPDGEVVAERKVPGSEVTSITYKPSAHMLHEGTLIIAESTTKSIYRITIPL